MLLLCAAWVWSPAASAAPSVFCPTLSLSVAHNASAQLDVSTCDGPDNFVIGPVLPPGPQHGTVSIFVEAGTLREFLRYTHNGDSATTDTFVVDDSTGGEITVTVTIAPASTFVVTTVLGALQVGVPFSQQMMATGGTGTLTWSGVTLPPGLSLSASGLLSGTPTQRDVQSFSVTATDTTSATATKSFNPDIADPNIVLSAPTNGVVGLAYSYSFVASNGVPPYNFQHHVPSGPLPPGLSFSGNTLSGTPAAVGTYVFGIQVGDDSAGPGDHFEVEMVSLTVSAAPTIVVNPPTIGNATVGVAYNASFSAIGGTTSTYTFSIFADALPPGLTLGSDGALAGTPTAGGTFNFTVEAKDGNNFTGIRAYTMTVDPATVSLPETTLANATVGIAYSAPLSPATGGTAPYTYAVTAGALPPGVALIGGALSGTPTAAGTFNFAITATDSSTGTGPYNSAPRGYSLQVVEIPPVANAVSATVAFNSGANPITLNITGGVPTSVAIGSAPAHGTAIASGLAITYQPNPGYAGPDSFTYTATNSAGTSAPATATITVGNPTITVTASNPLVAQVGAAYSQTFTWAGGTAPYSGFNVTNLPAGLSVTATTTDSVTVSGTPTESGTFALNASATDSSTGNGPFTVGQVFSLTVGAPTLSMTPAAGTLPLTYGVANTINFSATGGTASYSFSLAAGSLPVGVSFSSAGVLSGTPTVPGSYSVSIRAQDSSTGAGAPFVVTQNYVLQVGVPAIVISPATLPDGTAGTAYSQTFTASGGAAPYSFSLLAGALPIGMSLSSTGVLSGIPRSDGNFSITVRATDDNGQNAATVYTFAIAPPTIVIAPPALPDGLAGTPYSATLTASGGIAPYTFSIVSGALPIGVAFSSAGVLSGTPTAAGTFNVTIRATDDAGYNVTQAYSITIAAPTVTISPTTLPGGVAGTAYSQALSSSGGTAPYSYSILSGSLPAGVSFSSAGAFSGTPSTAGTFNLTVRSTDANGFNGDQAYSIVIAAPTIAIAPATLPGGVVGTPYSQALSSSGGTAPYSYSIVSGNLPTGVSFSSAGVYSGTPTAAGSYSADIRSTDANGFSATVSYTIAIADAAPVAVADSATTLAGHAATIAVTANDTGVIASVAVASAPSHGTATVDGMNVVYTPEAGFSGTDTFTYTAIGPGGASAPATVTVTVNPVPVAVSSHVETTAGGTVHVDLTAGATGGPFTAATLVSLSPASSGTATIAGSGGAYELTFVPAAGFSGLATVTFTLSNAYAVSAPATVEISVAGRSDPSKDPEVLGLLEAQATAARRFANSQIGNFQRRMENMHGGAEGRGGFQNGITFAGTQRCSPNTRRAYEDPECAQTALRDEDAPMAAPAPMQTGESARNPFGFWAGGSINRGDRDPRTGVSGFDFETSGVSAGGDIRLSPSFALGGGIGYGRDDTDIGGSGTRSESDAYTVAMYASYHPGERFFLDGLLGYQWLSFDNRRFVTDTGGLVRGERDGKQWMASLSTGMDYRSDRLTFSPYARVDLARARLDGYTEQGDPTHALAYRRQNVDTTTGNLGLRMDYRHDLSWGMFSPQLRLEFQHDFEDDGSAIMSYADLPAGPLYRALVRSMDRNRTIFGLGFALRTERDLKVRVEFRTLFDGDGESDNGVLLNIEKKY